MIKKIIKDNYGGRIYIWNEEMRKLDIVPGDTVKITIEKVE